MPIVMSDLLDDLVAETTVLTGLVAGLDEAGWRTATPADGWSIADQFSHLAFFDDAVVVAASDPDRFALELAGPALAGELSTDALAARYRDRTGPELLDWLGGARRTLVSVFGALDPARRLPWFGPPMSAASAVTARIMETWAHGQDVADALGVSRVPTSRLRHVAHLGVRALPYSFAANGLEPPTAPIRVELTAPGGELWTWGDAAAADRVAGPALDFCLLVTQRRHRDDTTIVAHGATASQWLTIAQAFAGPPGPGRQAGQRH